MNPTGPTETSWTARTIVAVGAVVVTVGTAGALSFLFQLDMPLGLVIVLGLLLTGLAVGRFYVVIKRDILREQT